jgi:CheY-like chemotaxis protein
MAQAKILIIDDDPDITETMKLVLENKQFKVSTAANGTEGLEQIEKERPDLIILDVMMNSLNEGFVLSRELKKNPKYKEIPILMVTAVGQKVGIDFETSAGDEEWLPVQGFLSKPVKPDTLLKKVKTLLPKR